MSQEQTNCSPLHGPWVRDQLQGWIALTKTRLFCNAIINAEIHVLHRIFSKIHINFFQKDNSLLSASLATIFLAGFLYALTFLIGRVRDPSIPLWNPPALCVSLLTAFSLSLVKRLHDTILSEDKNDFANQIILDMKGEDKAYKGPPANAGGY